MSLPDILLAIALVAILGPSLADAVLALVLVYTPRVARVVRAATPGADAPPAGAGAAGAPAPGTLPACGGVAAGGGMSMPALGPIPWHTTPFGRSLSKPWRPANRPFDKLRANGGKDAVPRFSTARAELVEAHTEAIELQIGSRDPRPRRSP